MVKLLSYHNDSVPRWKLKKAPFNGTIICSPSMWGCTSFNVLIWILLVLDNILGHFFILELCLQDIHILSFTWEGRNPDFLCFPLKGSHSLSVLTTLHAHTALKFLQTQSTCVFFCTLTWAHPWILFESYLWSYRVKPWITSSPLITTPRQPKIFVKNTVVSSF